MNKPQKIPTDFPLGENFAAAMLTMERASLLATKWRAKASHLGLSAWVMYRDDGAPKAVVVFADDPPVVRAELLWAGSRPAMEMDVPLYVVFNNATMALVRAVEPQHYYVGELGVSVDISKWKVK
jgi:hypothetical protein